MSDPPTSVMAGVVRGHPVVALVALLVAGTSPAMTDRAMTGTGQMDWTMMARP